MIFLIKGHSGEGKDRLSQRLAKALNPQPPAWPVDDDLLQAWQEGLAGWPESDPGFFLDTFHIDIDRVIPLVVLENRHDYPPAPPWSTSTPRAAFERWSTTVCLDVLDKHRPRVFEILCTLIDSVDHPVIDGSELGTSPRDSLLTRMILFKYGRVPSLRILLQPPQRQAEAHPTAVIGGAVFTYDQLLTKITRTPDGSVDIDPAITAAQVRRVG